MKSSQTTNIRQRGLSSKLYDEMIDSLEHKEAKNYIDNYRSIIESYFPRRKSVTRAHLADNTNRYC